MTQAIKITGLEQIRARMKDMESHIKRRMLIEAMKRVLKPTMQIAISNTPTGPRMVRKNKKRGDALFTNVPGFIKRSYRIKKIRSDNPFMLEVQLQNTAYYSNWAEKGHRIVKGRRKKARVVGMSPARNFLKKTYDAEKMAIPSRLASEIGNALLRRGF